MSAVVPHLDGRDLASARAAAVITAGQSESAYLRGLRIGQLQAQVDAKRQQDGDFRLGYSAGYLAGKADGLDLRNSRVNLFLIAVGLAVVALNVGFVVVGWLR